MDTGTIARLARERGIGESYLDYRGEERIVGMATRAAILRAMGIDVDDLLSVPAAVVAAPAAGTDGPVARCFEPPTLAAGGRCWGLAIQLYSVRSPLNWGIGDFGDLALLARMAAGVGADFIGVNPLHAGFAADPASCSPYSASSRHFLNVLYIAVDAVPDLEACAQARSRLDDAAFQAEIGRLRSTDLVDYERVARLKLEILRLLFESFCRQEIGPGTPRARAFAEFQVARGVLLRRHAVFEALDGEMRRRHGAQGGWTSWPTEYQDPDSPAAKAFAEGAAHEIGFHAWLQWIAESQLAGAARVARHAGMSIGLYGDYAVGANPGGSETWSDQQGYCSGASIGAPPDRLALKGQDWGLAAPDPRAMAMDRGSGLGLLMQENMRHFGALRIDHVMALYRLWWVPRGMTAGEGGYVHYPVTTLFDSVALASLAAACMVIGENLGTVPAEVDRAMDAYNVYGYKVLFFERDAGGYFKAPADWRHDALASVSTHDLPSLRAWWEGADIDLRARLGMYPQELDLGELAASRQRDRELLIEAMAAAGVRPGWPVDRFEPEFAAAVHAFVASAGSRLFAVQAEDLLGMVEPVNVPGTSSEYPNWRRKLAGDLDQLLQGEASRPILRRLQELRPRVLAPESVNATAPGPVAPG
jgi:4-alpha-glucanotransferase